MPEFFVTLEHTFLGSLHSAQGVAALVFSLGGVALVVAASIVRTMVPLRALHVASNVLLLVGAALAPEPANVVLYLVLLPMNGYRLVEIRRLTRTVESASAHGDVSGIWLKPYMKAHRLPAGAVLFHKGDRADSLYLLVEGEMELVEIGKRQPLAEIFGEISFFSPEKARTLTARCNSACVVLSIEESMFKQLYFQNPKLAFQISNLIAHRLSADIQRLQRRIDDVDRAAEAKAPNQVAPAA
jgi:CRP/FNR family transcriptional regulator, cyclic AMP receptor protein